MGERFLFVKERVSITYLQACSKYVSKLLSFIPSGEKLMLNVADANLQPATGFCHLLVLAMMDPGESVMGRL